MDNITFIDETMMNQRELICSVSRFNSTPLEQLICRIGIISYILKYLFALSVCVCVCVCVFMSCGEYMFNNVFGCHYSKCDNLSEPSQWRLMHLIIQLNI